MREHLKQLREIVEHDVPGDDARSRALVCLDLMEAELKATPPTGHIIDPTGAVRKVLGTLVITGDGHVVGDDVVVYFRCSDGSVGQTRVQTGPCWTLYSTREAAEASRREKA